MSSNVGSAFLAIFPVFNGFRKSVDKEVQGATAASGKTFNQGFTKAAQQSGASAGKGFVQGFTTNSKDVGLASLKTLQAQVRTTTQANSKARLAEQDAIGKVNIAQAAYNATIGKYAAGSVQSVKATEGLASAQRRAAAAGETAKGTFSAMTVAQGNLKKATEEASNSTTRQVSSFSALGSRLGASISDGFGGAMQTVIGVVSSGLAIIAGLAVAGATAVGVTIGSALSAGFSRLSTIETAQAKLKALGNTSADIAEIMKDANNAVIGTQYSLADAVTAAASATAAGIKPGKDLLRYLKLQGNAAAVAGVDFSDLGLVMNQVQSQNKAYTQDINQVAARGIPIYTSLAKVYGTTQEGLRDLLQKGGVDAAHFRQALELNVGNAADEIGKTTVGSFENMKAAFTRFGAALLAPAFPAFAQTFNAIRNTLDRIAAAFKPIIEKYAPKLATVFAPFVNSIGPAVNKFIDDIIKAANSPEGQKWFADMGKAFKEIGDALVKALPSIVKFTEATGKLVAAGLLLGAQMAPAWIHGAAQITDAMSSVNDTLATTTSTISNGTFLDLLGQNMAKGWQSVVDTLGNGAAQIGDFFAGIGDAFATGADQIGTFFAGVGAALVNGWNQVIGFFSGAVTGFSSTLSFFLLGAQEVFAQIGLVIGNFLKLFLGFFTGDFGAIPQIVADIFASIKNFVTTGTANIVNGFVSFGIFLINLWNSTWNNVRNFFVNAWNGLVGFVSSGIARFLGFFRSIPGTIAGIWANVTRSTASGVNSVVSFITGLPGRIAGAVSGAGNWLLQTGRNIVQGLINGITSMIGDAVDAVMRLAHSLPGPILRFLGIASPSRLFRDKVGVQIGAGIIAGVDSTKSAVAAAVGGLVAVPSVGTGSGASSSSAATWSGNAPFIGQIVAPDQNPAASGRIIGREFLNVMAGVR